ncbi:hypothetical protein ABZX39_33330 [Streptomyces collinus]|uniref:hypothetical protein n=1 Tax=Streptomyces collinus TaxID=42684 RepID=UPI0033AC00CC
MTDDSRARLIAYLCQAGLSTARANAVADDYAHSLAEVIRKQTARGNLIRDEFAQAWEQGLHVGADLIDPENKE